MQIQAASNSLNQQKPRKYEVGKIGKKQQNLYASALYRLNT